MQEHSLSASGFSREITMIDHGFTRDREKFVTEITIPVEKVFR
jgi:effector-binding domain-containing protein